MAASSFCESPPFLAVGGWFFGPAGVVSTSGPFPFSYPQHTRLLWGIVNTCRPRREPRAPTGRSAARTFSPPLGGGERGILQATTACSPVLPPRTEGRTAEARVV